MLNSKSLELNVAEQGISKQSKSGIYAILDHGQHENSAIPLSPNLLSFNEKGLNKKYLQALYCLGENPRKLSQEFRNNLLIFYLFLALYIIAQAVFALLIHSEGNQTDGELLFHLVSLSIIALIALLILIALCKSSNFLINNRIWFFTLAIVFLAYIILGDHRILCGITGTSYTHNQLPTSIGIVCFISMFRVVIFDCFYYIFILSSLSALLFLGLSLGYSPASDYSVAAEFTIIVIYLMFQTLEAQQTDYRMRNLFWRKTKEEENSRPYFKENQNSDQAEIKTETELLVSACDKIKQNIKYASSVILFKDVKNQLKSAQKQLENIKKKIARGTFWAEVRIEHNLNIDDQDRAFINENFMDMDASRRLSEHTNERRTTINDVNDKVYAFPFETYGVDELESVLSSVGKLWNFDIWFVHGATGQSISIVAKYLFTKYDLKTVYGISDIVIDTYFQTLEKSYKNNPYHNACHAADVLHTLLYFFTQSNYVTSLEPLDMLTSIIAALGHDVGHPGLTNRFLVNNREEVAIQYNDNSVLENMHCSRTFSLMGKKDCNLFEKLSNEDWLKARKSIIEMILETDMSRHFEILGRFRTRALVLSDLTLDNFDDRVLIFSMGLKCADIGHSAKVPELHEKWTKFVCEEFYNQGDIEKSRKQPVSMYCDREHADIAKSQAGFLKNICIPLFEVWCGHLRSDILNKNCLNQLKENQQIWEEKGRARRATNSYQVYEHSPSFQEVIDKRKSMHVSEKYAKRPTDLLKR
ncbi:unnamed protein product [Blepharisma stoltei]|uniref:Phosphodiesterase n=1 Tax=Blepharisma stoltei TaxID=1481888 RepID=A0AAU9I815_9CILI|nr:unnamed protein product [Blepharisma stoltei]